MDISRAARCRMATAGVRASTIRSTMIVIIERHAPALRGDSIAGAIKGGGRVQMPHRAPPSLARRPASRCASPHSAAAHCRTACACAQIRLFSAQGGKACCAADVSAHRPARSQSVGAALRFSQSYSSAALSYFLPLRRCLHCVCCALRAAMSSKEAPPPPPPSAAHVEGSDDAAAAAAVAASATLESFCLAPEDNPDREVVEWMGEQSAKELQV